MKYILLICAMLCIGCSESDEQAIKHSNALHEEVKAYENTLENLKLQCQMTAGQLEATKTAMAVKNGTAIYIVELELSQSHFSLNIGEQFKDSMNKAKIEIIADKRWYDTVQIGQVLNNDFRMGSAIVNGSWGNWSVKITNKRVSH